MAVEKMKLINITGPIAEFDRIVKTYVIDNGIHLENMFNVFQNHPELFPYMDANPYGQLIKSVNEALSLAGIDVNKIPNGDYSMPVDDIVLYTDQIKNMVSGLINKRNELMAVLKSNEQIISQVEHISEVDVPLRDIFNFKHIKIRFGKMPLESFARLTEYLKEYYTGFFFKLSEDKEYIYGLYCAPVALREKMDAIFASLNFDRMIISAKASGTPKDVIKSLTRENVETSKKIDEMERDLGIIVGKEREKLYTAYRSANFLYESFDVRKYAAHTGKSFYIAGWIPASEVGRLAKLLDPEPNVTLVVEEPDIVKHIKPPTKLVNNWFVRPFENYIKMYGVPSYDEYDPTMLFALSYSLMFGLMYGDFGQGLVLSLIGYLMQRKGNFLGPILKICGIVAAVFGLFYGSIFGFELEFGFNYKPMGEGNMTKTLFAAVALGAIIIGISMLFNLANGLKQKNIGRVLFDANGLAGFVFYWALIIGVLSVVMGNSVMKMWYIILFVIIPIILVFLKEPLSHLLERKKDWMPKNKGEFLVGNFFELFELLLSYITNTISFIRIGAFALNHAGMMMVVYSLANVGQNTLSNLNAGNVFVLIFGNLLVMGLEGLLVSIQVLRLEFYEMFSRYFSGDGKMYEPSAVNQK